MTGRLRLSRLEAKKKRVFFSDQYSDKVLATLPEEMRAQCERDLYDLQETIEQGHTVSRRFYRRGLEANDPPDELLDQHGIMHLHLAGQDSDILLFLVQFEEDVFFLQVDDHRHFQSWPKGKLLKQLHDLKIKEFEKQAELRQRERRTEAEGKLADAVKRLLGNRRKTDEG